MKNGKHHLSVSLIDIYVTGSEENTLLLTVYAHLRACPDCAAKAREMLKKGDDAALDPASLGYDMVPILEDVFASVMEALIQTDELRAEAVKDLMDLLDENMAKTVANMEDDAGTTFLIAAACGHGNLEVVKLLIGYGADVNAKDDFDDTPLHMASRYGETDIAEALVKAGARLDLVDNEMRTPLEVAIMHSHTKIAELLRKAEGPDVVWVLLRPDEKRKGELMGVVAEGTEKGKFVIFDSQPDKERCAPGEFCTARVTRRVRKTLKAVPCDILSDDGRVLEPCTSFEGIERPGKSRLDSAKMRWKNYVFDCRKIDKEGS